MSWLSTINHTSPFCDRASCCPWLEFAWENGGSRSPSRYVSRSQDDTGQHLRPREVAQCAKAFAHPAIAWGFGGNIIEYRNDIEIADDFLQIFWIQYGYYCIVWSIGFGLWNWQPNASAAARARLKENQEGWEIKGAWRARFSIHTGSIRLSGLSIPDSETKVFWDVFGVPYIGFFAVGLKIQASVHDVVGCLVIFYLSIICPYLRNFIDGMEWRDLSNCSIDMMTNEKRIMRCYSSIDGRTKK